MKMRIAVEMILDENEGFVALEKLALLGGGAPVEVPEQKPPVTLVPTAEDKPKRNRPSTKKAEPAVDATQQETPPAVEPEANVDLAPLSKADVLAACSAYFVRHGSTPAARAAAERIVQANGGFSKVKDCPVETYPAIWNALQEGVAQNAA